MLFRQLKALFAPLVILIVAVFLFGTTWITFERVEGGAFLINALLGALLGCALALLPLLYGAARERFAVQRWIACLLLLAVLVYQFAAQYAGAHVSWLGWLRTEEARAVFAEGCLIGYCLVGAIRARR